jgi:hypothetical protein
MLHDVMVMNNGIYIPGNHILEEGMNMAGSTASKKWMCTWDE